MSQPIYMQRVARLVISTSSWLNDTLLKVWSDGEEGTKVQMASALTDHPRRVFSFVQRSMTIFHLTNRDTLHA